MNCKPGDLAVVQRLDGLSPTEGRFVSIVRPAIDGEIFVSLCGKLQGKYSNASGFSWVCTGNAPLSMLGFLFSERPIGDDNLRPIRDPGEDAVDETLVPGYVRDEVTA